MSQKGNAAVPSFLEELRRQLLDPSSPIYEAMGWKRDELTRIVDGETTVSVNDVPSLVSAAGFVLVPKRLNRAVWTMAQIGASVPVDQQLASPALFDEVVTPAKRGNKVSIGRDVGQSVASHAKFARAVTFEQPKT